MAVLMFSKGGVSPTLAFARWAMLVGVAVSVLLTVHPSPHTTASYAAVGVGYCRRADGEWEVHSGECGIGFDTCKASCAEKADCAGFAHSTHDLMKMCDEDMPGVTTRCVQYLGEAEIVTTDVTQDGSAHSNTDYTCYKMVV